MSIESKLFLMDIQMFADEKIIPPEIEELEEELEVEEPDEEEQDEEELEEQEEEEEEVPAKGKKDKVTNAIIREKQANKALRAKIALLERDNADKALAMEDKKYREKLASQGYTEDEIEDRATSRKENAQIKRELTQLKYDNAITKLSSKYPDLPDHATEFIKIVESSRGLLTLEEVCKAKLDAQTKQEYRTKVEQETLLNKTKAKEKKFVAGENKGNTSVRFSAEDEEAYKYYLARNPGKTRKDYASILEMKRG